MVARRPAALSAARGTRLRMSACSRPRSPATGTFGAFLLARSPALHGADCTYSFIADGTPWEKK